MEEWFGKTVTESDCRLSYEEAQHIIENETTEIPKEVTILKAQAEKKANITRGEGDGKASAIFANAFQTDPEFFDFYRAMQAYTESLKNDDTTMILSPESEFFRYFGNPQGKSNN